MSSRRGTDSPLVTAGLVAVAGYVCLCFLVQAAANVVVAWRCGGSPPSPFNPAAAVGLFVGRIDWIVRVPQGCDVGTGSYLVDRWPGPPSGGCARRRVCLGVAEMEAIRRVAAPGHPEPRGHRAPCRDSSGFRSEGRPEDAGKFTRPGLAKPRIQDVAWTLGPFPRCHDPCLHGGIDGHPGCSAIR